LWVFIPLVLIGGAGLTYFLNGLAARKTIDWTQAQNLQLTNQSGTEFYPALAPDGKSVVYAAESDKGYDIFSLRIGGQNPVNLSAESPRDDIQPAFSPNGELIAFRSER